MKMDLSEFIKEYPAYFPEHVCDELIIQYETQRSMGNYNLEYDIMDNDLMKFAQIGLDNSDDLTRVATNLFVQAANEYIKDFKYCKKPVSLEKLRIKKYPVGGYFKEHVDATTYDHCTRYLAMFVYLNDSGGTTFFNQNIPAEKGKVVIFPPNWMFPHSGFVGNKPKYFLSTYLHYS